ncbi:MAG: N-6 DNA methylase [Dehalococcoidia bacterium]|nr:N-6 DNA methylase [Dehalococcoidia bacterium]
MQTTAQSYLDSIWRLLNSSAAREESYYEYLAVFLRRAFEHLGRPVEVIVLPRATVGGYPDLRVSASVSKAVGHIETKGPRGVNLDAIEYSEQLARYRGTFQNLILTDFLEFRLYRSGERVRTASLCRPASDTPLVPTPESISSTLELLDAFASFAVPEILTPSTLATELAKLTRFLREEIHTHLQAAQRLDAPLEQPDNLLGLYAEFRDYLLSGMSTEQFVDLYAQTVTYGLFAARVFYRGHFTRASAFLHLPPTIGILRELFRFSLWGAEMPSSLRYVVDDICAVLDAANVHSITGWVGGDSETADPIYYFYETFLQAYDPEERAQRGVYYTPPSLVSYIVTSVNEILKNVFSMTHGLASEHVTLLDPAAGTLTFLAKAADLALDEFIAAFGTGGSAAFASSHILKDFYAFELQVAPYVIGHLKLPLLLQRRTGLRLRFDQRPQFFLTNTLEVADTRQSTFPGLASLSAESYKANIIKNRQRILAIVGNPPYFARSWNNAPWITQLIQTYYQVDGQKIDEVNTKWLRDDYVKFIRFAQWKIEQVGEGVLGFVTNHGFLDNPTFRGMRKALLDSFDQLYVLDLHGYYKEKPPAGLKDDNVFDILRGVSISLFIKKPGLQRGSWHSELWGDRPSKLEWLSQHSLSTTQWQQMEPRAPLYLLKPLDADLESRYMSFPSLPDIFPTKNVGIVSSRDALVVSPSKEELCKRLSLLRDVHVSDDRIRRDFAVKDSDRWKLSDARSRLRADDTEMPAVIPICYRPFDFQWILYEDYMLERSRRALMGNMLRGTNLGLLSARGNKSERMDHAFCTRLVTEAKCGESTTQSYLFPLYLYRSDPIGGLFAGQSTEAPEPNLAPVFLATLQRYYGRRPSPEEILGHAYAILYSPTYRATYTPWLKRLFPRIPFPTVPELFDASSQLGQRLVELHTLESPEVDTPTVTLVGDGLPQVDKVNWDGPSCTLHISNTHRFLPVPQEVWEYRIGGYRVLSRWLEARRGRALGLSDIRHFCRTATALRITIDLEEDLDASFNNLCADTIPFESAPE